MTNWRVNLIFVFIILFSAVILSRLVYLQILKGDFYKALSLGLHNPFSEPTAKRGEIFFKNGEPLAINKNYSFVFASPKKVKDPEKIAEVLSPILNLEPSFILEKLKGENFYSLIKKRLSEKEQEALKDLNLKGISLTEEKGRYYPQENLASNLVGFLGAQGKGQYGLEEFFEEDLAKGTDLVLTLNYLLQYRAEELLKKAKEDLGMEAGQIIIMEPSSGKILALANFPNFNPNSYQEYAENLEVFKNLATQGLFEPGSVFKPITMAAALEEGKITPKTTYYDPGKIKIDGWTIQNYEGREYPGQITMTEVLEKSINTGAVFAKNQIPNFVFLDYIKRFGFFEPTLIEVLEVYSENRELKNGREINFATASYGQGIMITPIQLARAYCAIANSGKLVRPHLIERPEQLSIAQKEAPQVISQKTASQLKPMLVSVVENGFAKRAKIPGYYIAGKTGTALQPKIGEAGYSEKTWQTFVGFFPAFNPKFLVLVKLDNPKTKTAEYSTVPIFRELAEYIIHLYQIPPDYE